MPLLCLTQIETKGGGGSFFSLSRSLALFRTFIVKVMHANNVERVHMRVLVCVVTVYILGQ